MVTEQYGERGRGLHEANSVSFAGSGEVGLYLSGGSAAGQAQELSVWRKVFRGIFAHDGGVVSLGAFQGSCLG